MTQIDLTILLTKEQKAKELGVNVRTIDRRIKKGKMSFIKIKRSARKWFLPKNTENLIPQYESL